MILTQGIVYLLHLKNISYTILFVGFLSGDDVLSDTVYSTIL